MEPFEYRGGELWVEGCAVDRLAEAHGTPLYVYSLGWLRARYRRFAAAFGEPAPLIAYSVKANPSLAVVAALAQEGAGADVVSGGELRRALRAGVAPERIVFSGVGKARWELEAGVEAGILAFNVEVAEEVERLEQVAERAGRRVGVAVRVNPDVDARSHRYITVGKRVNKFGIPLDRVPELYGRIVASPWLEPLGVDCHIGSQMTSLAPMAEALERLGGLIERLRADGGAVRWVDVGGGLGVRYTSEEPPSVEEYAKVVREGTAGWGVELALEPGRWLVAEAGALVSEVLYRKEVAGKRFVIVDAAMNDLARPALYQAKHRVVAVREGAAAVEADVVGPICETGDFLSQDQEVPDAAPGERVAVLGAGAYARSMASNYNSRPRGAEVLVEGERAHLIQSRERFEDLVAREQLPEGW